MFAPSHTAQFISTAAAILVRETFIRQPWLFYVYGFLFNSRGFFYVTAAFCIYFQKMLEYKKYISFILEKSEKYKKQKKYIDKTKRVL